MSLTPVALFVYNRPFHTKKTVENLQQNDLAKETPLYIFSDGPKNDLAIKSVEKVRNYIRTVTGFKEVNLIEREKNLGLAHSIISGVTTLIKQFGQIIVLEDDLLVSAHFLSYMNKALERFRNEERVMQISGYMFPVQLNVNDDAIFLPFITTWGWGTWERAWTYFDPEMSGYQELKRDPKLRYKFNIMGSYPYFKMLKNQYHGKIHSWGIRWNLSVFNRDGLTLYPTQTFVKNIGFDGSGIHSISAGKEEYEEELPPFNVNKFPDLTVDVKCLNKIKDYLIAQNSCQYRFFQRIQRIKEILFKIISGGEKIGI